MAMARIRTIKPEFFFDEDLAELPFRARLFFIGLWCMADKAGRLTDSPKKIKATLFPYDEIDPDGILDSLAAAGFIQRYEVDARPYIQITGFGRHQKPHHSEKESEYPAPTREGATLKPQNPGDIPGKPPVNPGDSPGTNQAGREGKGKEGKGREQTSAQPPAPEPSKPEAPKPEGEGVSSPPSNPGRRDIKAEFLQFWLAYPRKVGRDDARRSWERNKPDLQRCLAAINWQKNSEQWRKDGGQYIPHPATWLNQGRWADVPPTHIAAVCHQCGHDGILPKGFTGPVKCSKCGSAIIPDTKAKSPAPIRTDAGYIAKGGGLEKIGASPEDLFGGIKPQEDGKNGG